MSDRNCHHCPFLNRADARCAEHFSLDQLGHAFDYCFGYYESCGVYRQLLAERQARRSAGPGPWVGGRLAEFDPIEADHGRMPLVQLTVGQSAGHAHAGR